MEKELLKFIKSLYKNDKSFELSTVDEVIDLAKENGFNIDLANDVLKHDIAKELYNLNNFIDNKKMTNFSNFLNDIIKENKEITFYDFQYSIIRITDWGFYKTDEFRDRCEVKINISKIYRDLDDSIETIIKEDKTLKLTDLFYFNKKTGNYELIKGINIINVKKFNQIYDSFIELWIKIGNAMNE